MLGFYGDSSWREKEDIVLQRVENFLTALWSLEINESIRYFRPPLRIGKSVYAILQKEGIPTCVSADEIIEYALQWKKRQSEDSPEKMVTKILSELGFQILGSNGDYCGRMSDVAEAIRKIRERIKKSN